MLDRTRLDHVELLGINVELKRRSLHEQENSRERCGPYRSAFRAAVNRVESEPCPYAKRSEIDRVGRLRCGKPGVIDSATRRIRLERPR